MADKKDWFEKLEENSDLIEQYLGEVMNGDKSHCDDFKKLLKSMVIRLAKLEGRESLRREQKEEGELSIIGQ